MYNCIYAYLLVLGQQLLVCPCMVLTPQIMLFVLRLLVFRMFRSFLFLHHRHCHLLRLICYHDSYRYCCHHEAVVHFEYCLLGLNALQLPLHLQY